jgi:hypothetical protein
LVLDAHSHPASTVKLGLILVVDDGDESDIKSIEKEVAGFKEWLVSDESRKTTYLKMIEQTLF